MTGAVRPVSAPPRARPPVALRWEDAAPEVSRLRSDLTAFPRTEGPRPMRHVPRPRKRGQESPVSPPEKPVAPPPPEALPAPAPETPEAVAASWRGWLE